MIRRLDHVAIAVGSIDDSLKLFEEALGLQMAHTEVEAGQRVIVAFLKAGQTEVELIEPIDQDGPVARFIRKRGEGIHHVCFEVDDLEATLAAVEARGIELVDRQPYVGTGGKKVAFVHPRSTHGVLVEFYERGPVEPQLPRMPDWNQLRERLADTRLAAAVRDRLNALQRRVASTAYVRLNRPNGPDGSDGPDAD